MQWWTRFIGSATPGYRKRKREAAGQALMFMLFGFAVAYMLSEFALSRMLHPVHWAAAGISAVLLYVGAYIWMLHRLSVQQAALPARRAPHGRQ